MSFNLLNRIGSSIEPIYRKYQSIARGKKDDKSFLSSSSKKTTILREFIAFLLFVDMNENGTVVNRERPNNNE